MCSPNASKQAVHHTLHTTHSTNKDLCLTKGQARQSRQCASSKLLNSIVVRLELCDFKHGQSQKEHGGRYINFVNA